MRELKLIEKNLSKLLMVRLSDFYIFLIIFVDPILQSINLSGDHHLMFEVTLNVRPLSS